MGNEFRGQKAHSAEHFGDTRDHWWNLDFLRLMSARWKLDVVKGALDVGCGVGHWGMLLASVMRDDVRFVGIDREEQWVNEATARARARGLDSRFSFRCAEASALPFEDDTFDLVTCQTVLIHMADPMRVVAEMKRVTKPGGLVAVAEPNNLTESLLLDSITSRASTEDIVELVRFQLTCERGKIALGEGDSSLGDRVPGLFVQQGLVDVETYVNDKATAILPPYETAEQRAFVEDARDRTARRMWNWSEHDARRLFVAGGGVEEDFDAHFARAMASREKIVRGVEDGSFHGIVGGEFYLVAGRKPEKR